MQFRRRNRHSDACKRFCWPLQSQTVGKFHFGKIPSMIYTTALCNAVVDARRVEAPSAPSAKRSRFPSRRPH